MPSSVSFRISFEFGLFRGRGLLCVALHAEEVNPMMIDGPAGRRRLGHIGPRRRPGPENNDTWRDPEHHLMVANLLWQRPSQYLTVLASCG
jgi:hypothetical protein